MGHIERLGLKNITDDDIHTALTRFSLKWQDKAGRVSDERVSRH